MSRIISRFHPALLSIFAIALCSPAHAADKPTPARTAGGIIDAAKFKTLQEAFDAVPESGGVVRLPAGTFRIEKTLVISTENTRVEGTGTATHLVNCCKNGQPVLHIRAKKSGKNIWRVQLANFRVSGDAVSPDKKSANAMAFVGEPPAANAKKPLTGDGILAERVNEIYIEGITADHCGRFGVNLDKCYEDPRVCDSIFTYNAQAGLNILGGHDIVVNANHFEENLDAVRCIDSYNLCMNGNNLDDHIRHGVVIENTYGSVLSGNMIEECEGVGVILDRDCYGITISANVIADNFGGGIDLRDAWGCAVSANTFTIDAVRALVIGPNSGRITVTGNNFSDSFIGKKRRRVGKQNLATGITLQGTSDICITGNVFSGLSGQAVTADKNCTRLLLVANIATDLNVATEQKRPAFDLGGAKEVISENNMLGPAAVIPAEPAKKK
ncbi:MAG: right-handed parallel beta-helix repeat-containing protein [Pirellulales bacterium]|nr:right-handed parallel beta-helix repeat-containing protein [Pirellulales bacterium]